MKTPLTDRSRPATVLICSPDPVFRDHLTRLLAAIGGYRAAVSVSPAAALQSALEQPPDLLICSHEPALCDGITLTTSLRGKVWVPVLLAAKNWTPELVKAAVTAGVAAFLASFPTEPELAHALIEARIRLEHEDLLRTKLRESEQRLADRKVIEKAKGLLMEQERISEDAAFKLMRSQSMTRRVSMAQLAEELLISMSNQG
ncbi:ANTAR domain-containing response regulator [Trichlorobacter thiogenes]|uniref:ANTAR domain-containing response regulator n=1 Tax=Trichlorobacter thiogenes TaxID=115783 RepID=UPI00111629A7|nr:ANTAR domain-containing protein [Trichlorobacter thiogenes]